MEQNIITRIREAVKRTVTDRIEASMGLKLVVALTGVISALMIAGTVFVGRMMMQSQYQALETHGREMARFLGRAGADPLFHQDIITLDSLVGEATKSEQTLYTYVTDTRGAVVNNIYAVFNKEQPAVRAFLGKEKTEDLTALLKRAQQRLDTLDVRSDIMLAGNRIGTVVIGFSRRDVRTAIRDVVALLLVTSVIIIVVMASTIYFMAHRMIVAPTREAVETASNIAAGDLSQGVRVHSMDELGMLGRGLNRMIIGLKGMIDSVRAASRKTDEVWREVKGTSLQITSGSKAQAESVEEAASSVNEMHFALKEIAANVEDLYKTSERTSSSVVEMAASTGEVAKTMSELSASIEETSAAIAQMSAAVRQIAENVMVLSTAAEDTSASAAEISASVREVESTARESSALAEAVAADAEQLGMRSIEKTIDGMNRLEAAAQRTADVVNRLGERAENIGSILTVIEDITDQTSLLALNAAILAAQAGEHGKGFAVVASQIRELATRTATSTKEIGALIVSVQEETRGAVGGMRDEVKLVEESVQLARETGDALRKILERADRSRDMSRSINKAAAEQTRGIRQVSEAVEKINSMTHQIAHAANEQRTGSEQITRASEKMRELTHFVKNSTDDQAKGSKEITAAVENMSTKIGMVNRAAVEVQAGSDLIVKAIDRIKEIAAANAQLGVGLNAAVDVMVAQTEVLKKEIGKFKTT